MTDVKFLSRKLIISILMLVLATLFLAKGSIDQFTWKYIVMAIVGTYVVGKTIEKNIQEKMTGSWHQRILLLFSREFVISIVAIAASSVFLYYGKISGSSWFEICLLVSGAYNIMNPISKITP